MANPRGKKTGEAKQLRVKMVPNFDPKLGRIYSNFVQISHSPWDFTVRFCDAPPGDVALRSRKGDEVEIPTIVEVIIPVNLMSGLIKALNDQNEKYRKAYGEANGKDK